MHCAACGFDYTAFREDNAAYERFLVALMREGPMGQLGALAVHDWTAPRWASARGQAAASLRVIAEREGIALPPPGGPISLVRMVLVLVALVVLAGAAALINLVLRG